MLLCPAACAPGYYSKDATPRVCEPCPKGFFCPGGVGPVVAKKISCGTCLTTITTASKNSLSCITSPGCAFKVDTTTALGFIGSPCVKGKYSAGGTRQACTACPSILTTSGTGANSIDMCSAPAGYYYKVMIKLACGVVRACAVSLRGCMPSLITYVCYNLACQNPQNKPLQ